MMPPQPEDWGARRDARTAPASQQDTSPVYAPGGYQPTVPPMYPQAIPPYAPPRKRSPLGWILAFIGMGLFAVIVFAVMMIARKGRQIAGDMSSGRSGQVERAGEIALNESTADQVVSTGNETAIVKTYPLDDGATFSLKNINGSITVGAWDQPKAEVKVIRRGSDRNAQVFVNSSKGNVSIRTATTRNSQEIRYEVKLPRQMRRVDLNSTNGSVKLSDLTAEILVYCTNGTIELANVVGASKIHTVNGNIKATLLEAGDRSMEFENTNGNIDLAVPPGFKADLEASTSHGDINIDQTFGVTVEKGLVGQRAKGEIGNGGERLKLTTTNGSIRLTQSEARARETAKEKRNGN